MSEEMVTPRYFTELQLGGGSGDSDSWWRPGARYWEKLGFLVVWSKTV